MSIKVITNKEIEKQKEYISKIRSLVCNKKYYLMTMGCQLNENDSEKIAGMAEDMGYTKTDEYKDANLVIFNTCCIRENAENKILGHLGILKAIKKEKKDMVIALGGCMAQEPNMIEKFRTTYGQHIDVIFGTHNLYKFPELLYNSIYTHKKVSDIWNIEGTIFEGLRNRRENKVQASVTIMNGCNNFCSYCIVPYVRGRERSREPSYILKEVQEIADNKYKEVVLLGQNVNSYGKDLEERLSFASLLEQIAKVDGIERIRFVTPHPKDFSDDLIDVIKNNNKICRVIHLPLQSGSSRILKLMNRKYTKEEYLKLVDKIKKILPDATFTTDIIVGFPSETEDDFLDTLDVVKSVRFNSAYTYIYSRRVGTPADKMEDQIDEEIKKERIGRLIELTNKILEEQNEALTGTIQKVLVEGKSKTNEELLTGRTDGGKVVVFSGTNNLIGQIIDIKIIEQRKWYLLGRTI